MSKKLLIIIIAAVVTLGAIAAAIAVPLVVLGDKKEEKEKAARQSQFDASLDAVYETYLADVEDGVIDPAAYAHIEGRYDPEEGVTPTTVLSRSEVLIGKPEEDGTVSLYQYGHGTWTLVVRAVVEEGDVRMQVAKYVAIGGHSTSLLVPSGEVLPGDVVFLSYTYLTYGEHRIYAS